MESLLVIMMSLSATGLALVAISKSQRKHDMVFRFVSFPKDGVAEVFLITAQNSFEAFEEANKFKMIRDLSWQRVEQLDPKDHSKIIKTIMDLNRQVVEL